jgi:hypothetical protein
MLLLNGQNPVKNATVIPTDVIQMVSSGISVYEGDPYVSLI